MIIPPIKRFGISGSQSSQPLVSPRLLMKVEQQKAIPDGTRIDMLGLEGSDIKRLGEAGIFTLKQLVVLRDRDILNIPHFGIIKIRRLKATLKSYLTAMLKEENREHKQLDGITITESKPESGKSAELWAIKAAPIALDEISKNLEKIEKRLLSLETEFVKAKMLKNQRARVKSDKSIPNNQDTIIQQITN